MKKVIIIGAGPAGIACGIQLKRFGIDCIIFEKNEIGGLVKNANLIENYLGFPTGITGIEYADLIKKQFEQYKIPLIKDEITKIDFDNDIFEAIGLNSGTYKSEYLVIATGTVPEKLNFNEDVNEKIFYEIKDMPGVKNKTIAIIGAGDAAFDYALNLAKNNRVKILNRSSKIKALPLLLERAKQSKKIEYYENITVQKIIQNNGVLQINDNIFADYLVIAIGRVANDSLLTQELKENPALCIIGDVKNGLLRQTAIATADGLKAAVNIYDRINQNKS